MNGDLSNIALPKAAQKIFKSIFDARLGNTTDGYPNYDGWRGDGKVNTPVKEISNVTSD